MSIYIYIYNCSQKRPLLNTVNTYVQEQNKTVTFTLWNCTSGSPAQKAVQLVYIAHGHGQKKNMLLQNWVLYNSLFSLTYDSTALKKTDTCTRNAWPAYATDLRWQNILRYHMSPLHKWKLQKMNRRTMSINRHLQKNKHAQQGVMAGGSLMQNLEEQGICSLGDLLCT